MPLYSRGGWEEGGSSTSSDVKILWPNTSSPFIRFRALKEEDSVNKQQLVLLTPVPNPGHHNRIRISA